MPKRKSESQLDYIVKKLKYLEKEIHNRRSRSRRRRHISSSSSDSSRSRSSTSISSLEKEERALTEHSERPPKLTDSFTVEEPPRPQSPARMASPIPSTSRTEALLLPSTSAQPPTSHEAAATVAQEQSALPETETQQHEGQFCQNDTTGAGLNPEILDIFGVDPTTIVDHGPPINPELANRLSYIATSGLKKEERKEITNKYLVPENCLAITAPELNPEIKAALSEGLMKRDKALESRQKSIATVISCLSMADHEMLKHLFDASRLLCDIQYSDSTARKSFALNTLKKDLKEQLSNTKIGKQLFGETLGETIKTAKAVTKSVAELKEPVKKSSNISNKHLNWKTTGGTRRQTAVPLSSRGQPPPAAPATTSTYQHHRHQPAPPVTSSSASSHRPRHNRRRLLLKTRYATQVD
ncbi:hypothetical protein ABMA28_004504 [Loxostege sticticalis]|uniref:Uncharacterized protein n=1 Tax=Loxostege sticticalis TaxID=481309 RepID=A0ABD0STT2_LOXSC